MDIFSRGHATLHLAMSVGTLVGPSVRRSVTFLNSERFSHYCSCPTVRDWIAVYPALFSIYVNLRSIIVSLFVSLHIVIVSLHFVIYLFSFCHSSSFVLPLSRVITRRSMPCHFILCFVICPFVICYAY